MIDVVCHRRLIVTRHWLLGLINLNDQVAHKSIAALRPMTIQMCIVYSSIMMAIVIHLSQIIRNNHNFSFFLKHGNFCLVSARLNLDRHYPLPYYYGSLIPLICKILISFCRSWWAKNIIFCRFLCKWYLTYVNLL